MSGRFEDIRQVQYLDPASSCVSPDLSPEIRAVSTPVVSISFNNSTLSGVVGHPLSPLVAKQEPNILLDKNNISKENHGSINSKKSVTIVERADENERRPTEGIVENGEVKLTSQTATSEVAGAARSSTNGIDFSKWARSSKDGINFSKWTKQDEWF